jgi:hypothetical protein
MQSQLGLVMVEPEYVYVHVLPANAGDVPVTVAKILETVIARRMSEISFFIGFEINEFYRKHGYHNLRQNNSAFQVNFQQQ